MHIEAGKLKSLINVSISFFMAKAIGRKLCQFYKKVMLLQKKAKVPHICTKRSIQEIKNNPNDNDDKIWFIKTLNAIEAIECIKGPYILSIYKWYALFSEKISEQWDLMQQTL